MTHHRPSWPSKPEILKQEPEVKREDLKARVYLEICPWNLRFLVKLTSKICLWKTRDFFSLKLFPLNKFEQIASQRTKISIIIQTTKISGADSWFWEGGKMGVYSPLKHQTSQDAKQEWLDGGVKKIESLWGGQVWMVRSLDRWMGDVFFFLNGSW